MQKIIAAFDGLDFSQSTLQYGLQLAGNSDAQLVGVFLDDCMHHSYQLSDILNAHGGISDDRQKELNEADNKTRNVSADLFEDACVKAGISYKVHRDKNVALQELIRESIYSDLLIINKTETFTRFEQQVPTEFLRDLLLGVYCPVLIVPDKYQKIEEVVLLYDGQPSSIYAIKMFGYILPGFKNSKVQVLTIKNEEETLHVPDGKLVRELVKRHYPQVDFIIEKGDPEEQVFQYLKNQKRPVAVLGAYGRVRLSQWFKPSIADLLLKDLDVPLFIAHPR